MPFCPRNISEACWHQICLVSNMQGPLLLLFVFWMPMTFVLQLDWSSRGRCPRRSRRRFWWCSSAAIGATVCRLWSARLDHRIPPSAVLPIPVGSRLSRTIDIVRDYLCIENRLPRMKDPQDMQSTQLNPCTMRTSSWLLRSTRRYCCYQCSRYQPMHGRSPAKGLAGRFAQFLRSLFWVWLGRELWCLRNWLRHLPLKFLA